MENGDRSLGHDRDPQRAREGAVIRRRHDPRQRRHASLELGAVEREQVGPAQGGELLADVRPQLRRAADHLDMADGERRRLARDRIGAAGEGDERAADRERAP